MPTSPVNTLAGVACTSSDELLRRGRLLREHRDELGAEHVDRAVERRGVVDRAEPEPAVRERQLARGCGVRERDALLRGGELRHRHDHEHPRRALGRRELVDHAQPEPEHVAVQRAPRCVLCEQRRLLRGRRREPGTLVERWNGSTWKIVGSPNPKGATAVSLTGVSCPTAARCVAVGDQLQTHVVQRVVEMWNGSRWTVVSVPVPKGTKKSDLSGVSCAPSMRCFAVGDFKIQNRRPLIERYA